MTPAQFILCNANKVPVDPATGQAINPHDPTKWMTREAAERVAALAGLRVGFVLTAADPYFVLDIDHCLQGGQWTETALGLLGYLPGAYVEVSQSGEGLHVIGRYVGARPAHRCKVTALGIELYTAERYVMLTGDRAIGNAETDCTAGLHALIAAHFDPAAAGGGAVEGWTSGPVPQWRGPEDDDELLARACKSVSAGAAFAGRAAFADLWEGRADALATAYPPQSVGQTWDGSSADAALAAHLAFWTGSDCERMKRLMLRSALVRDKWDREAYLDGTIQKAAGRQSQWFGGESEGRVEPHDGEALGSGGFMTVARQAEYFKGCVYVQDQHRALVPGGALLKPEQFKATYGGHTFAMDNENRRTSRNAWEAFTESQALPWPKVESSTFNPQEPEGAVLEYEGRKLVNTYVSLPVARARGDVTPFMHHLALVLPDEHDRRILLNYMAAIVQRRGVKFQWAPLLQGVAGNGKTLFTRCVAHAVGLRYSHFPKPREVSSKFNSWIVGKLLIGMEDVYLPDHKGEVIEELKPLITNDWLPIEAKGVDQITQFVCANFMLNMNRKDGLRKTRDDRRFCVFYTAQQLPEDLRIAGMTGDYFPRLYTWLRGGGYAAVAELLHTLPIEPALDPAGECHRAPGTTTSEAAIRESVGGVEQEILEAVEQEVPGFADGWISSMALDKLLGDRRLSGRVTRNQRRTILEELGYVKHPALVDGRVNNRVMPDNGKPRLYVRSDSNYLNLSKPAEVERVYSQSQTDAVNGAVISLPPVTQIM